MAGFSLNPYATTNAAGLFGIDASGFIQGCTMDSPAIRNQLAGGVVALTETVPMYGGMAISEAIPTGYVSGTAAGPKALGGYISRATAIGGAQPITGFTVFDQAYHGLAAPQTPVPLYMPGMGIHFYRLGSNARIPLACDPSLISLQGGLTTAQVSWDFYAQRLIPFAAAYGANAITNATYNQQTGVLTFTTSAAHGLNPGQDYTTAGFAPAGYNGSFTAGTGTAGSTLTAQLPMATGATSYPALASPATTNGTLVAGGGALPLRVLEVASINCITVNLDPVSGYATYNRNGACALVQI